MSNRNYITRPSKKEGPKIHVSKLGADTQNGTPAAPFKTIGAAAMQAMPGDTILVHPGTYRERIDPPRGGESDARRITYQAAEQALVEILGSEVINNWECIDGSIWQTNVSNKTFGEFNPYSDRIEGDWFNDLNRPHHTGCVYLDNQWLIESENVAALAPMHWFAKVGTTETTFWANFGDRNPNTAKTEINVRPTVFYPTQTSINYITVAGFSMRHAATNWSPPTAEQIGLIGTNWSKGWIIENNVISHSRCAGVTLGKYGDAYDNTSAGSATGYLETIQRAQKHGWDRDHVGSHIVRNNRISHCEQAGIVGSLGAIFSEISGNRIHDIYQQRTFAGEELGAIKIHGAIDTLIARNRIYNAYRGIWLDWMAQGARVTQNVCHNNNLEDLFLEVNHGPNIVDHNCFLSAVSLNNISQGSAFVQNVFGGKLRATAEPNRETPSLHPHSTKFQKTQSIAGGDDHYINNIVVDQAGLDRACAPFRAPF
jgi:alpha-N-arabinofuranosidase